MARLRFGHQRPLNRRCPDRKYQYVNNNRLTEYPGTPAWTPTIYWSLVSKPVSQDIQSICYCLHTGIFCLDTCDLVVTGVRISILPKYLYLYLELSGSTCFTPVCDSVHWEGVEVCLPACNGKGIYTPRQSALRGRNPPPPSRDGN